MLRDDIHNGLGLLKNDIISHLEELELKPTKTVPGQAGTEVSIHVNSECILIDTLSDSLSWSMNPF